MRKGFCVDPEFSLRNLGLALHTRLINGDRTASAEIAEIFLPHLLQELAHAIERDPDPHTAQQAAIDALWNYLQRPEQYDPTKLSLLSYLVMSAYGDKRNAEDSARRYRRHYADWQSDVADWKGASEYEAEYRDDHDFVEEILRRDSNVYATVAARLPSPTDQYMVELMLESVHRTETYALVLGITHLPAEEQARLVKQHKDRIKVRLRRTVDPEEFRAEARAND